jgi:D-3-phosphoglycerate dehydrogenase
LGQFEAVHMAEYSVVVTDHDFHDLSIEREVLSDVATVSAVEHGFDPDPEEVDTALSGADGVLNLRQPLDAETLAAASDCRIVARYGTGVDNVDVEVATERDIAVTNVPECCVEEVSTHAIALLLGVLRGVPTYIRSVADGQWDRGAGPEVHRFSTLTIGVIGFGAIGRDVARRLDVLGADVIASDPFVQTETMAEYGVERVEFDGLVERSDAITIHSPLTEDTRGLFDAEVFLHTKDSAVLINVARGPIVDVEALHGALMDGQIAGAGLDVFPNEPPAEDHPLCDHERVLVTPHVAWYSEEANAQRRRTAAENVRAALTGEEPANVVNGVNGSA